MCGAFMVWVCVVRVCVCVYGAGVSCVYVEHACLCVCIVRGWVVRLHGACMCSKCFRTCVLPRVCVVLLSVVWVCVICELLRCVCYELICGARVLC
jgi:hypothetical protein